MYRAWGRGFRVSGLGFRVEGLIAPRVSRDILTLPLD